jgi:flagellar hook assembly protein FlgD
MTTKEQVLQNCTVEGNVIKLPSEQLDRNGGQMKTKHEIVDGVGYLTFKVTEEIGLMKLPVITKGTRQGTNAWTWNGDLEKPTLRPSVRTGYYNGKEMTEIHYWLNDGIADCLSDCKDGNAGKKLALMEIEQ